MFLLLNMMVSPHSTFNIPLKHYFISICDKGEFYACFIYKIELLWRSSWFMFWDCTYHLYSIFNYQKYYFLDYNFICNKILKINNSKKLYISFTDLNFQILDSSLLRMWFLLECNRRSTSLVIRGSKRAYYNVTDQRDICCISFYIPTCFLKGIKMTEFFLIVMPMWRFRCM
jgi:hypothetical protein